jgi:hypothetical protein
MTEERPEKLRHLVVEGTGTSYGYTSPTSGPRPLIPTRDRAAHGRRLLTEY